MEHLEEPLGAGFVVHIGAFAFGKRRSRKHQVRVLDNARNDSVERNHIAHFCQSRANTRTGRTPEQIVFGDHQRVDLTLLNRIKDRVDTQTALQGGAERVAFRHHEAQRRFNTACAHRFGHRARRLQHAHVREAGASHNERTLGPDQRRCSRFHEGAVCVICSRTRSTSRGSVDGLCNRNTNLRQFVRRRMQQAGRDVGIVGRQYVGRVQRAACVTPMHADARVLPRRNCCLLAQFECHITHCLTQRQRDARRRLQHVFA